MLQLKLVKKKIIFPGPERISEQMFEITCRLKMKESGWSVWAFTGGVLRTTSAELFHSYALNMNLFLWPSRQTYNSRDIFRDEGFLSRTPVWFFVEGEEEKRGKVDVYRILPGCFVVVILQKVYLWSILDQGKDVKTLEILVCCFFFFSSSSLQLLCGQPLQAFNAARLSGRCQDHLSNGYMM